MLSCRGAYRNDNMVSNLQCGPLARRLGFDAVVCTRAALDASGRLTGELDGGNCYGANKLARVRDYLGAEPTGQLTVFYTDHHTDLLLLRFVHQPVAVNPTRELRRLALEAGIPVEDWH